MSDNIKKSEILYQIRIDLEKSRAFILRSQGITKNTPKLKKVFDKYNAELICQYDAFKDFVDACEKDNNTDFALYRWTKDTISKKEKIEKYTKSFTIYLNDNQLYEKSLADALELELKSINCPSILKIYKYDSNPANNPQPPKKYH
ncbi:MAG: hypothetical protein CBE11_00400 [Rickettsiales bacterium TMED251]|nr:MAG: hypothetical protein CBE11_00400 [Rickettsiales bacterium TMED251]|tara:strand:+ start:847 stop:1284 length:438 start_codon:yes stop_codon:yes gene_type:complete